MDLIILDMAYGVHIFVKDRTKSKDSAVKCPIRFAENDGSFLEGFAKVSTDSRRQEESLENQTATYERLIRSNPEYAFVGVYADQGISGYCEKRPQFQKMRERVRAEKIDMIITKSISRFARNTVNVLKAVRELKEQGVGIFLEDRISILFQGMVR